MKHKSPSSWINYPANVLAEWFGVGHIPPSGTMGTIAALPILWLVQFFAGSIGLYIFTIIIVIVGWISISFYQRQHASHDAKQIVIDEVAGMGVTLCFLPADLFSLALGFVLFRIFDIFKPYPIHLVDSYMHSALGVMLDDLMAGVYAGLLGLGILAWLNTLSM